VRSKGVEVELSEVKADVLKSEDAKVDFSVSRDVVVMISEVEVDPPRSTAVVEPSLVEAVAVRFRDVAVEP
jgi:hypothetical protein